MDLEQILKQIRLFADNVATLASDVSTQVQVLETITGDVSSKLIAAKDALKTDLYKLQDNLSTIDKKVKEYFDASRQDNNNDGNAG